MEEGFSHPLEEVRLSNKSLMKERNLVHMNKGLRERMNLKESY